MNQKETYEVQNCSGEETKSKFSVYKGLLLAMISAFFYSIAAVLVKEMTNIHPGQLTVYRFLAILVFSLPEAVMCRENLLGPKGMRFLLFIRGIFGATNSYFSFLAFRYLPIGESSVIVFSVPVFVTIAANVVLKEPCGIFQSVTVFTTIAGIILITKLPLKLSGMAVAYTKESIWGFLAGIGSVLSSTCQYVAIRKLKDVHYSILMVNFGWVAILETVILTALMGNFSWHDCGHQGLYVIVLGVLSYSGQVLLTTALLCEFAGPVCTMRGAVDIVLAFIWQILLFQDVPDVYSSIGAVLVGSSVVFIGLRKWVSELPPDSTFGRIFFWILK